MSVKGRASAPATSTAFALDAPQTPAGAGRAKGNTNGPDPRSPRHQAPEDSPSAVQTQGEAATSYVLVRGTAPRVSAAGTMLLERLKVRERGGGGGAGCLLRARSCLM